MMQKTNAEYGYAKPGRRKRLKKRHILVGGIVLFIAAIFVGVPIALHNRDLVVSTINRNAGIAPMRIDLKSIEGGWLRSIRVHGLRLIDDKEAELITVDEIETDLNLLRLATNYKNLGTITIRGAKAVVDVQPGTTNIEEAIKPLLTSSTSSSTTTATNTGTTTVPSSLPTGRIRIADAIVHLRDSVDLTSWDLKVSEADIPLPTKEQPIPPMTLIGLVQQTASLPGESLMGGQFTIRTQPIADQSNAPTNDLAPMKMNIATNGLPLQWFSLVKRRLPEIPIERLLGLATVQADIEIRNNNIQAQIQTAQIDSLRIIAPALVGKRGAGLQQIKLSGNVQLNQNRLLTQNATLQCDIGALAANADMPWPPMIPSMTHPWINDADFEIQGNVDLARLIQVAPDLVQMQDQVQLLAGTASLAATQRKSTNVTGGAAPPTSNYRMQLGGLQANVQGTKMQWDQALQASVDVSANSQGQPSFKADCTAEFCKIEGNGDLQDGQLAGQFDRDKMQQRLSQWFALPVESLSGSAECKVVWKQDGSNRLTANGKLQTTPVKVVNKYGQLDEPAWDGDFDLVARVDQGRIIQIDRGQASFKATGELLSAQVLEPISLVSAAAGVAQLPPAGIQLKLIGDLGGWQRRGQLFAGVDPGIKLGGKFELDARGALDTAHLEVTQANFITEPFMVKSGETTFRESRMVGNFNGRIDSQNIGRLQVDNLLVQSESFALQAKDAAVPNRELARQGQAGFRIDPSRLMSALQFETATGASSSDMTVEGDVTGQIVWQVDPQQLAWQLISDAKNIRVLQKTSTPNSTQGSGQLVNTVSNRSGSPSVLWEEPQAKLVVDGRYEVSTGKLEIPKAELMTEWIAYAGKTNMTTQAKKTMLVSQGNMTYDAARVAQRLRPWTGDYLTVQGQRTQPVEVIWTSSESGNWAESLQAKSQIGWDSASIVGIEIGTADFPLKIENGHFLSRAEIPVSQGKLRWNLDGDVASDPIVIAQSPEKVIDNVAITRQMCQGWLKYVAPILADVASVQGNLSLQIEQALIVPTDMKRQTIKGQLQVHGAKVGPGPLADQLLGLVQQVRALRKGAGATDGGGQQTTWLQLPEQKIGFDVQQGRVAHKNMQIQAGDVVINTSGSVGIDGQLELIAAVPILKDWVDKTPLLQSLAGQQIQIPVRGTIQRPQMDLSSFASIGQQLATAALQGAAQKQIDKGIGKLLGPLSQQLGPLQQGMQQMQQGVQQNLPQFPNLQNFQIPGFGNGGPFGGGQPPQAPQPLPPQN